jgi:hypothetical protein
MERKLRTVEALPAGEARALLGLEGGEVEESEPAAALDAEVSSGEVPAGAEPKSGDGVGT